MKKLLGFSARTIYSNLLFKGLLLSSKSLTLNQKPAMIFSPHQDDETLGCAGVIALKRDANIPVTVVFLTNGAKSPVDDAAAVRRREAAVALDALGVASADTYFLDQPDGGLSVLEEGHKKALIRHLTQLILTHKPQEIYVPHRQDRHHGGDHEATYELVKTAIEATDLKIDLLQYPIWILWHALPFIDLKPKELAGGYRLFIGAAQARKQKAISAYVSQTFPQGFLDRFRASYEIFFKE
ncbi:MAG: PIG-L family deacetylase [Anaerolineae bacterium]|nr:PIG-L family deacetylase [Gloeobacterales cyanobacterium ES-bin-313]